MGSIHVLLCFVVSLWLVNSAVVLDDDVDQQGLYSKSDGVTILTKANFDRKVYNKRYGQLVQFYNSYCGHCRNFYPKYKQLASEIVSWNKVFRLAVVDCFNEENNEVCRDFEVMSYPSLRYFHEHFVKANDNIGERLEVTDTTGKLKVQILNKLIQEQNFGRFSMGPSLKIAPYNTYADALYGVPTYVLYTFLVFEDLNSTIGSQLALDLSAYENLRVKRVLSYCELANDTVITHYPALIVSGVSMSPTQQIIPVQPTNMLKAVKKFLRSKNYPITEDKYEDVSIDNQEHTTTPGDALKVYYTDLEITLRSILHTEINHKTIYGDSHRALVKLLEVLRDYFPYKGNDELREFLEELSMNVQSVQTLNPTALNNLVKDLENKYHPYKSNAKEYIGCRGSQPRYRGYTCGLWTLFHALTVSAASNSNSDGPKVLRAMHGFVTYFFGCTECVQHFLAMADRNKIFDVKYNDRVVLWLWISHNEVNLRLAGDITEDPKHPKIQFPSANQCPQCRLVKGAWNLPEVYQYLLTFYGSDAIQNNTKDVQSAVPQLSAIDLGMLSFLYLLSFILIILVIKYFISKRFYKKRIYKHEWGKV